MKYTDTISNRKIRSELYAKSGSLVGSASITENLTVGGTLTTKDINVNSALITAGSVVVATISAGELEVNGEITATEAVIAGDITASQANIKTKITAGDATINGSIIFSNLPVDPSGIPVGSVWNNAGVLNIIPPSP